MYSFLFDRRSMTLFLGGATVMAALLFASGVLVGMRLALPPEPVQQAAYQPLADYRGALVGRADAQPVAAQGPMPQPELQPELQPEPQPGRTALGDDEAVGVAAAAEESESVVAPRAVEPPAPRSMPSAPVLPTAAPSEPAAVAPEPTPPATPRSAGRFEVQVGAFGVLSNAEERLQELVAEGYEAHIAPIHTSSGRVLSAVRFGGFADRQAARAAANRYLATASNREAILRRID